MIQFANKYSTPLVRKMWKTCFGDTDEYMDLIFTKKYKEDNTLIYFEKEEAVASLQMQEYNIRMYEEVFPIYYLAGLCTLPEHRNKGYMGKLITEALNIMQSRDIALTILVPANEQLFNYYEKYGFTQAFRSSEEKIDLSRIIENNSNFTDKRFQEFDRLYQQNDFTVLKTKEDLSIIIEEYIQCGCPTKYNLNAMARIIDVPHILKLYAQNNPQKSFSIKITDDQLKRSYTYQIGNGEISEFNGSLFDFQIGIETFTRLIFGFEIQDMNPQYSLFFEEHSPVINLMLE